MRKYLRVANILDGYIDTSNVLEMPFTDKEYERFLLKEGDILLNEGQSLELVGRSAIYKGRPENCCFQNTLIRFSPGELVHGRYAQHLFRFCLITGRFAKIASRTTSIAHLGVERFSSMVVPVPPLPEQEEISRVAEKWDRAIDLTERLIAAKQERRTWLMQQLLTGKRRLPGFEGDWRTVHLGEIFERVQRSIPDGEFPEVLSITAKVGFVSQRQKFSKVIAGKNLEHYVLIRRGEFSYNKGNSLTYPQGCVFRLKEFEEGAVPSVFYSFRAASPEVSLDFYSHFFSAGGLNHQLSRVINSGVRNDGLLNLNASDFFALRVPLPPLGEQERIAEILSTATNELALLRAQLDALREQKKGLMQQLLTGKVRVRVE